MQQAGNTFLMWRFIRMYCRFGSSFRVDLTSADNYILVLNLRYFSDTLPSSQKVWRRFVTILSTGYIAIWQHVPYLPGCLKENINILYFLDFLSKDFSTNHFFSALFETSYFVVHDLYFPKLVRWRTLPLSQSRFRYFFLPLCTFSFETAVFRPYPKLSPNQLFQKHSR